MGKKTTRLMMTTETGFHPQVIEKRLGIISAECVSGVSMFKDIFSSVTDALGGRSRSTQGILRAAQDQVLDELSEEARMLGANAVIAVDLDFSEISGGGKSMLFVVATGTAAIVR